MAFVNVALDVPLNRTFTYSVPEEFSKAAEPGTRVVVPFRKRQLIGYIVEADITPVAKAEIKDISSLPDKEPIISKKMLKLIRWISDYYSAPLGEVFTTAMPSLLNNIKEIDRKRKKAKPLHGLEGFHKKEPIVLNPTQNKVWKEISKIHDSGRFAVALLHGVTGSGKTEIYLKLIKKVLKSGRQVILLVPEISLTPQLAGRVISNFGENVAIYHSGLTETQRLHQWQLMKNGKAGVVVGTRSAIFAPFNNLGAIIIDEEHDHSYKQEESPRYNARDTATMRGKFEEATVLLGSATPSIESLANARKGKYNYFKLPERHGGSAMPEIKIVDMRKEPKSELLNPHLSIELMAELKKVLKKKQQVLLFLNRRGYANFFLCQDCGYVPECPNCKITLTFHKRIRKLICHYCDLKKPALTICPNCRGPNIAQVGSGTEMIEEVIREKIPDARVARMDRDTATTEKKRRDILSKMHKGDLDILIGTQMITKGHDFPKVTLVGVISADQSIHFPDFRSGERTFQLLTHVSGRAGRRALHPGKVIIQTYLPEHVSIKTASEYNLEEYISSELAVRRELSYPPFSRIANIRIIGNKEEKVIDTSKRLARMLAKASTFDSGLKLLGPAPAPLTMIRGKVRWQILLKSPSARLMASTLSALRGHLDSHPTSGVQVSIDVDPVSIM